MFEATREAWETFKEYKIKEKEIDEERKAEGLPKLSRKEIRFRIQQSKIFSAKRNIEG